MKGDHGETTLLGETRVAKDDIRIEALGEIDELMAVIGMVRATINEKDKDLSLMFTAMQRTLMDVMSCVAGRELSKEIRETLCTSIKNMEKELDNFNPDNAFCFVIPGENEFTALLNLARTKVRTAERRLWTVNREYPIDPDIMRFMNRFSDFLFMLSTDNV